MSQSATIEAVVVGERIGNMDVTVQAPAELIFRSEEPGQKAKEYLEREFDEVLHITEVT